jgi:membrane fusion protein (multidrug efflux system)
METVMDTIAVERSATAAPVKRRVQFRLKHIALAGLALAITLAGIGYGRYWWTVGRFIESTDDAYAGGNVTPVAPHVSGFVAQILVTDNQHVRAGQLLIRLDERDFKAALDHAQAVADQRQAALTGLEAKYVLQQAMIRQAEADLNAKDAHATFADADAVRYRELASTTFGTRQNAERALSADREAQSATKAAQASLAAARQQLTVLDAEISEARAGVAQAKADLKTARLNLGYTEIRSPIDGYVGNRAAQVGAYVTNGAYLLSIIPAQGLWVDANFKEDQLAHMRPGQPVTVVADVLPGKVFQGHVESLAPGTGAVFSVIPPENATGNFTKIVQRVPVRIALDDGEAKLGALRPGLSTTVSVDTRPAPTLPSPASGGESGAGLE